MIFRNGFVTNSSSSSFILGKIEESKLSVNDVYIIIKDLYKQWLKVSKEMILYCEEQYKISNKFPRITEKGFFSYDKGLSMEERTIQDNTLKQMFGISRYEVTTLEDIEWLKFETYDEYYEHFLKIAKDKTYSYRDYAPFSIDVMTNIKPNLIHNGYFEGESDDSDWCYNEVVDWYLDRQPKDIDENIVELLGQVCVYSECGKIPDYIVRQLGSISNYYCNHMG